MQLVKKVEELTLYTLDQENELSALQEQNHLLATENAELSDRLSGIEARLHALSPE